jgi:hypothetical protein
MTVTDDQAWEAAGRTATGDPADRILERLAELVGAKATVQAVFAEPVRQGPGDRRRRALMAVLSRAR